MEPKINDTSTINTSTPPQINTHTEENPFSSPQQLQAKSAMITTPITTQQGTTTMNLKPQINVPMKTTEEMLENMSKKIDNIEILVKKIKRHYTISMWLTIIFVILPIVASVFALPYLMKSLTSSFGLETLSGLPTEYTAETTQLPTPGKQISDTQLLEMLHNLQSKVDSQ